MAVNKIERIDREIEKTREKITEYQNRQIFNNLDTGGD